MNLTTKLKGIYINKDTLTAKEMERSRNLSIFEGCTARTIITLTGGAFLVGFAKYMGASDQIAGIIAAIPILAGIIMAFSPILFEGMENRKFITCMFCFIGRLMLGSMIIIPFINISDQIKLVLLMTIFLIANLFISFAIPSAQAWLLNITPEGIRGRYFGRRESIVLGTVTAITLLMGQILDKFEQIGQQFNGFVVLYSLVIILAVINLTIFSGIKEPKSEVSDVRLTLKDVLTLPLFNKKFMRLVLLLVLWNLSFQLGTPFTIVYMVSGLKLSYGVITLMAVLASLASVIFVRYWGRVADRTSWIHLLKLMVVLQIFSFFIWFLINKYTLVPLLPIAHILSGAAISGINISVGNLQYEYSPEANKTVFIGFSSAIGGIFGFIGTLIGSFLTKILEIYKITVLNIEIGNVQFVFLLSCLIMIVCMVYINRVLRLRETVPSNEP